MLRLKIWLSNGTRKEIRINYVEATTNVPLNRLNNKTQNVRQSLNNQHSALERVLMFSGWSQWNLGVENEKMKDIKERVKGKKSKKRKTKGIKTRTVKTVYR